MGLATSPWMTSFSPIHDWRLNNEEMFKSIPLSIISGQSHSLWMGTWEKVVIMFFACLAVIFLNNTETGNTKLYFFLWV